MESCLWYRRSLFAHTDIKSSPKLSSDLRAFHTSLKRSEEELMKTIAWSFTNDIDPMASCCSR
jgi:hypothetical protein